MRMLQASTAENVLEFHSIKFVGTVNRAKSSEVFLNKNKLSPKNIIIYSPWDGGSLVRNDLVIDHFVESCFHLSNTPFVNPASM